MSDTMFSPWFDRWSDRGLQIARCSEPQADADDWRMTTCTRGGQTAHRDRTARRRCPRGGVDGYTGTWRGCADHRDAHHHRALERGVPNRARRSRRDPAATAAHAAVADRPRHGARVPGAPGVPRPERMARRTLRTGTRANRAVYRRRRDRRAV